MVRNFFIKKVLNFNLMYIHHFMRYKPIWGIQKQLKTYLNSILIFFYKFVCFPRFKKPQISLEKPQIWQKKNRKFCPNHQKSTNIGFCDNSFDRSLVLILKYTVCQFYDCTTVFEKMRQFRI